LSTLCTIPTPFPARLSLADQKRAALRGVPIGERSRENQVDNEGETSRVRDSSANGDLVASASVLRNAS